MSDDPPDAGGYPDHATRRSADPDGSRLLVVEDDPADAGLVLEAIGSFERGRGHPVGVELVSDGESAIEQLTSADPEAPVDLVLLDLHLPGVGGHQVLMEARRRWDADRLPVVVLTGLGSSDDAMRCYDAGANAVVSKPVDLDGFVGAIDRILAFWLGGRTDPEVDR